MYNHFFLGERAKGVGILTIFVKPLGKGAGAEIMEAGNEERLIEVYEGKGIVLCEYAYARELDCGGP